MVSGDLLRDPLQDVARLTFENPVRRTVAKTGNEGKGVRRFSAPVTVGQFSGRSRFRWIITGRHRLHDANVSAPDPDDIRSAGISHEREPRRAAGRYRAVFRSDSMKRSSYRSGRNVRTSASKRSYCRNAL